MVSAGVTAVICIIGVEFVAIGFLVTYLLYRRRDKDALKPKGPISTSYDEAEDGKKNGDVTLQITDDEKKPLPSSSSSSHPSTPESDKKLLSPEDTSIHIEDDESPQSTNDEETPLTQVVVDEHIDPSKQDENYAKKIPGTPPPPFDDKSVKDKSDESSLDEPPEAMDIIVPQVLREPVVAKQPDNVEIEDRPCPLSSRSSSESDVNMDLELGKPEAVEEKIVPSKSKVKDLVDKFLNLPDDKPPSESEEELIHPSAVRHVDEGVPRRRSVTEDDIVPKHQQDPRAELEHMLQQEMSSSDEEDKAVPAAKPRRRRRRPVVEEPIVVAGSAQTDLHKDGSSSESEDEVSAPKKYSVIATQTDKRVRLSSTSSSSSSSESEDEAKPTIRFSMSTQTVDSPPRERSRRKKTQTPASPSLRSRTLSPASTQTMEYPPPRRAMSPVGTQTYERRIPTSASSSMSESDRRRRPFVPYRQATVPELVQHYENPESSMLVGTSTRVPRTASMSSTHSSMSGRGTQTWSHDRGRHKKKKIIIAHAEMQTQTYSTPSITSSASYYTSSSSDEEPEILYVYEKGIQTNLDSSDDERGRAMSPEAGTQTTPALKRKRRGPPSTQVTSKKISLSRRKSEPVVTNSAGTGTDAEHFKSETKVHFMASPTTVVFASPTSPKKNIVFKSAWNKEAKLCDLHDAGIISDKMKEELENGQIYPDDANVLAKVKPYLEGEQPVAGLLLMNTGEKITLFEAANRGIIRRGNAVNILEAQVATGSIIDPKTGIRMSVEDAAKIGVIDKSYVPVLQRAERSVVGYQYRARGRPVSVYEAMRSGDVVNQHGLRLLQAQLVTGGLIDPRANHRVPERVAYRRNLCDPGIMRRLETTSDEYGGFFDPTTGKNVTYKTLMSRCIKDLDTGVRLLPVEGGFTTKKQRVSDVPVKKVVSSSVYQSPTVYHEHHHHTPIELESEDQQSYKSEYFISGITTDVKGSYLKEVMVEAVVQKMAKDDAVEEEIRRETESSSSSSSEDTKDDAESTVEEIKEIRKSSSSPSSSEDEMDIAPVSKPVEEVKQAPQSSSESSGSETIPMETEANAASRARSSSSSSDQGPIEEASTSSSSSDEMEIELTPKIEDIEKEEIIVAAKPAEAIERLPSTSSSLSEEKVVVKKPFLSSSSSDEMEVEPKQVEKAETVAPKIQRLPSTSSSSSESEPEPEVVAVVEPVKRRLPSTSSESSDDEEEEVKKTEEIVKVKEDNPLMEVQAETLQTICESKEGSSSGSEYEDENGVKRKRRKKTKHLTTTDTTTTVTTTVIETTETSIAKKRWDKIKFVSGWKRKVTLENLFDAGVISEDTVQKLEDGSIEVGEVQASLQQYLVGDEPIGGLLISETGEKMSIYTAWKKGLIRRGTSISLLEAQAATGRMIDPVTAEKMSVEEASKVGLIDRQFEAVLARAERAVYGYKTRFSSEVFSLFQAMKRGLVVENHGVRLLEAQIATGGIIDPKANHRLPVEAAFRRGLFDETLNQVLEDPSDDTRGFFDPNTQENLTYLELMERCVFDKDTGLRLLPLTTDNKQQSVKHSKVIFESMSNRPVMIHHVLEAEAIDQRTADRFEKGEMSTDEVKEMVGKLKVFVDGTMPIAGIINSDTSEKMTMLEAVKTGLIRKGTAFELLEAQACCGKLMDVQTGRSVSIEAALKTGIIESEYEDIVTRAHRAVTGYKGTYKSDIFSLCDAINRHLIIRKHGIRLIEAQLATGGIIDLKSPVRINVDVAEKRHLIDARLAKDLRERKTKSFFDPVTGENINYSEMLGRCVVDKDTGMLFLMIEPGTITSYASPYESDPHHKIRSRSFSPVRTKTEVVETKSKKSSRSLSRTHQEKTIVEETETIKKSKKKHRASSTSSTASGRSSILSRQVVIVDPNTDEELTIDEARKRRLIDKATYKQLKSQEGVFDEETEQDI